ncbi:hypothetical protein AN221_21990, partial [Streptomyces nanshensis]
MGPPARPASGAAPSTAPGTPRPGRRSATPSPDRGAPVPAWVRARIRYAEEAAAFEQRLAEHLAEHEAVTEEFRRMARAAWERARLQYPRALATFGSDNPSLPGSVGTTRPALQQVLRTGNLRELVTFLFQGISSDLVPELLGGREDPDPQIEAERPSRRQAEGRTELERLAERLRLDDTLTTAEKQAALARATAEHTLSTDPDDVRPPLSRAERALAVNEFGLTWMPASSVYDLAMDSAFQGTSEDTGGLVLTGTAGSTYRFLVHAARMRDQWGIDLDLGLIRAGMIAMSLSAGHHSFHEVMRGAQLALDTLPGHDPALDYQDNWGRYWNVYPLTEQELRRHVARDGRFPDEHAQEVRDEHAQGVREGTALPAPPAPGSAPSAPRTEQLSTLPGSRTEQPSAPQAPRTEQPPALNSAPPGLRTDPPATLTELADRLPDLPAAERTAHLALLTPAEREQLAGLPGLAAALRSKLGDREFADTVAQLVVQVAPGVDRPVSAGHEARTRIAAMLRDPAVATRLLEQGARVLVVPKDEALTTLGPFRDLAGRELPATGRTWDTVRGVGRLDTGVTEENLLGETPGVPGASSYADGYSTTTHEFAHAIHRYGLSDADRRTITDAYRAKLHPSDGRDPADVEWPDGPRRSARDGRPADNYSSTDEFEYFAQAVNAYLGTNSGTDPLTGHPRNNGPAWVRDNEPDLLPLLERLFGTTPEQDGPGPANPVEATRAENEMYEGFRAMWDRAEGVHRAQPHPPVPAPPQGRTPAAPATHPVTDAGAETPLPPPPTDPRGGWAEFPEGLTDELDR